MIGTKLVSTGRYLPERRLTNQMLTEMVDTSEEWIVQRTGIAERRIAEDGTTADLAIGAAKNAMQDCSFGAEDLDFIIACTATPDSFTPSIACRVQAAIHAEHAFAFDVSAACSGFVYSVV